MKKYLLIIAGVIAAILSSCVQPNSQAPVIGNTFGTIDENIETQVNQLVEESGVPSIAMGIVVKDKLVWAGGYGPHSCEP